MPEDSTNEVHEIKFFEVCIKTTVTASSSTVDKWISDTYRINSHRIHKLVVGLDTEWRLNLEPNGYQPVAIIQLCVGQRCLIFQLFHADTIPLSLVHFLANSPFTFTGVGVKGDRDKIFDDWGLRVSRVMDVAQTIAKKFEDSEYKRNGLRKLMFLFTAKWMEKPKRITLSQWDVEKLSYEQIEYACIDAYASFVLGLKFYDFFCSIKGKPLLIWHPHLEPYKDCRVHNHRRRIDDRRHKEENSKLII